MAFNDNLIAGSSEHPEKTGRPEIIVKLEDDKEKRYYQLFWTRQERKQWSWALFVGSAALYMCRTVMPLCIVSIAKDLKWDKTESGAVLSSFFWGYCMTQILGGYISDRIGGDLVFPIVAVFWSLITMWTPWIIRSGNHSKGVTLVALIASRVCLGWSQGFHYPSVNSLLGKKVSDKERSFTYCFICSGSHLGTLLCGCVGSLLMDWYGWPAPFYACGVAGILWLLMLRFYLLDEYRNRNKLPRDVASVVAKEPVVLKKPSPSVPWLTLFKSLAFWSLLVGHFCTNIAFYILLSWLPSYFHENFPDAKGWVFNVVPWLVTVPSTILGGWVADALIAKFNDVTLIRKVMQTITLPGMALFLFILTFTSTYHWALVCMTGAIACSGFHNSGIAVNPQDIAPNYAGAVFGFMNMAGAIPGFVGVYMAGHILEVTQSWNAVFHHTSVICLVGWAVFLVFGTGKKIV